MKIAFLVPSWPPGSSPNGIVTYASELIPALRQQGHEVFVLTGQKWGDEDPYTIDLRRFAPTQTIWDRTAYRIAPEPVFYRRLTIGIIRAIKRLTTIHQWDVLEMEESFGACLAISRLNLLPVIVRLHGPWFLTGPFTDRSNKHQLNARREKREGRGIQDAHFVISPAARILEAVKSHYKLPLPASRIIANPIKAGPPSQLWDARAGAKRILFVGRFDSLKGGDLVLRAFADLAESCSKVELTFVGPDHGIREKDGSIIRLEEFVRRYIPEEHRSRIHFQGQITHSAVMSYRRSHLVAIVASEYEVAPYTVLEGFSLGCPVIATAVGGIPELIEDNRNGLLVPAQDVKAMSNACRRLLKDHSLAVQLGREALRDCRRLYDPAVIAKQVVGAYGEAIEAFKSRSNKRAFFIWAR
jgi:glycosyltransferase involved in cell wall biosynthesis